MSISEVPSRFLVVGCGSIGKRHIKNLLALGAKNILAFDVRSDRRTEAVQLGVTTTDNLESAWKFQPEVALITVPTSLHVPLAFEAAKHGCDLFIEKPLSDRLDHLGELSEIVRRQKLITLVGCNLRFHSGLLTVKRLLQENAIGMVLSARMEFGQYLPDWHPWEDYRQTYSAQRKLGGGIILDAIHEIDLIQWIMGEVETVACFAGKVSHLEIDTEDVAVILLRFSNGAIGEIHLDYVQRTYSRSSQLIGEEGTIRWNFSEPDVHWYSAKTRTWADIPCKNQSDPNQMYLDEMKHFLRCIVRQEHSAQDIFEAERVLKIALAAKRSAEKQEFVKVSVNA
jgi:predicted dehydrogenase